MVSFMLFNFWLSVIFTVSAIENGDSFTISTKGCTIPGFPYVSENIKSFVHSIQNIKKCDQNNRLVDSNNTHIWIIKQALYLFNIGYEEGLLCCYRGFASKGNIENIKYEECVEFSTFIKAKHAFVRIECYYADDKMYDDFFVFSDLENYPMRSLQGKEEHYNILIFGIESMSRMNFHRTMANTAEYLYLNGAIELLGYNKLGDNSYPNLFPLIFGKSYRYVKENCFESNGLEFEYDECSFIWDRFKDTGYHTALGSDSIAGFLGEFEYNLTKSPTHFYLQPFIYETRHLFQNSHYSYHQCLGSRYIYTILLNYIEGLINNLNKTYHRFFGLFWEESISHEDLNDPYIMDNDYVNFLFRLGESGYLNNTVLIFLSDHGMRWGDIVNTQQGRLEERLPLVQFLFPESFKRRHRKAFLNFKDNSQRLTTPYDVYETLRDLANPAFIKDDQIKIRSKGNNSRMNATSLFLPISDARSCKSIDIEEHWCSCYKGKKLRVTNTNRKIAAGRLISHVNKLLEPYPECHQLNIKEILQVLMVQSDGDRIYTVMIITSPGDAVLDGTLIKQRDRWVISGTISRHNLYQSDSCIDNDLVKMYCFCSK